MGLGGRPRGLIVPGAQHGREQGAPLLDEVRVRQSSEPSQRGSGTDRSSLRVLGNCNPVRFYFARIVRGTGPRLGGSLTNASSLFLPALLYEGPLL